MTKRRLSLRQKSIATVALLVVASLGVAVWQRDTVASAWSRTIVRQSQPYTALSFIDTGHLPTYAPAGTSKQITFRLANHEATDMAYRYRATLTAGATLTVLSEEAVVLRSGSSVDKTITFVLPEPEMTAQITVQLVDRTEYITFGTAS